jgi:transcriptional regulator with XRE-family HTH domain
MLDETTIRKRIEALKDETMSRLGINSVDEFLERTGMKRSAFYELINGKTRIVNRHLRELAAAFEVTEEYLLLGYDPVREEELHDQDYFERQYEAARQQLEDQIKARDRQIETLTKANEALRDSNRLYGQLLKQEQKSTRRK